MCLERPPSEPHPASSASAFSTARAAVVAWAKSNGPVGARRAWSPSRSVRMATLIAQIPEFNSTCQTASETRKEKASSTLTLVDAKDSGQLIRFLNPHNSADLD